MTAAWRYKCQHGEFVFMEKRLTDEQKARGYYLDDDYDDDGDRGPFQWSDETPLYLGVAQAPTIRVKPMELSDDRVDYFVSISVGDREITPYVFRDEQFKAEYEAASFRWLLLGDPKPDLMAYSEDGWPSAPSSTDRDPAQAPAREDEQ